MLMAALQGKTTNSSQDVKNLLRKYLDNKGLLEDNKESDNPLFALQGGLGPCSHTTPLSTTPRCSTTLPASCSPTSARPLPKEPQSTTSNAASGSACCNWGAPPWDTSSTCRAAATWARPSPGPTARSGNACRNCTPAATSPSSARSRWHARPTAAA